MLSECHTTGEGDACAVSFAVMRVLVHDEKRPQLHHQCASLDLMQLVKKHQATKPLMPDPQKRFQLDGLTIMVTNHQRVINCQHFSVPSLSVSVCVV